MKSFKQLIILLLMVALSTVSCLKDEFTAGEIGDGTIVIVPEVKPDPNCSKRTLTIDVDSALNSIFFPFIEREYCDCDTVDVELTNIPESVVVLGIISEKDTTSSFKTRITGITEPWYGQLLLIDAFDFIEVNIPIRVDFDKCP